EKAAGEGLSAERPHGLSTAPSLQAPPPALGPRDAMPGMPGAPDGGAPRVIDPSQTPADGPADGGPAAPAPRKGPSPLAGAGRGGLPEKKPDAPQVWHRDAKRPAFARVYVGDNNSLELVSLHVTVTVEGPRARTLVDHVFRNPHDRQLEGTFEYPLPTGA